MQNCSWLKELCYHYTCQTIYLAVFILSHFYYNSLPNSKQEPLVHLIFHKKFASPQPNLQVSNCFTDSFRSHLNEEERIAEKRKTQMLQTSQPVPLRAFQLFVLTERERWIKGEAFENNSSSTSYVVNKYIHKFKINSLQFQTLNYKFKDRNIKVNQTLAYVFQFLDLLTYVSTNIFNFKFETQNELN